LHCRYYPYHYAPFASDFSNLNDISIHFNQNSKPFKPLEQLMSVFPPECAKYLPNQWQSLILEKDSPIIDFYPLNFSVDSNGKRFRSQYVVLLPFIDEIRLHKTLQSYYSLLTSEEKQRNEHNNDLLFIHSENSYYSNLKEQLDGNKGKKITQENPIDIPTTVGIVGCIWRDGDDDKIASSGKTIKAPISNYINITNNQVMCIKYRSE
jgi:5'-3' exoribonuclease 2